MLFGWQRERDYGWLGQFSRECFQLTCRDITIGGDQGLFDMNDGQGKYV